MDHHTDHHTDRPGHVFGRCNPLYDMPWVLRLYRDGQLELDELISRRYTLATRTWRTGSSSAG